MDGDKIAYCRPKEEHGIVFAPKRDREQEDADAGPNDDNEFGVEPKKPKSKTVIISGGLVGLKVHGLCFHHRVPKIRVQLQVANNYIFFI